MKDEDKKDGESDDVVFEDNDEEDNPDMLIKKLRERLKKAEKEKSEYLTGWQKERAESVNIRKRSEEEKKEFAKYANESLILDILPTLDSFDLAFRNKEAWEKLPKEWTKGVEYIYSQLLSVLESNGVKRIYPLNEKFDPSRDEALDVIHTENKEEDHKVLEVTQPGYTYQNKLIRTAKVKIGEFKES